MILHRLQTSALASSAIAGNAPAGLLLALLAGLASATTDEAAIERAVLPPGVRPLLTLLVDTSAAMAAGLQVVPEYDPARDYRAAADAAAHCDPARVYWRRGPGSAPDCASHTAVESVARDAAHGFHCAAARIALERTGVFVAARAAQWQPRGRSGYWREPRAGSDGAIECLEDRGRHGGVAGEWYAADGGPQPWAPDARREPRWNAAPLAVPYVFFSGNYLNYLATARADVTATAWEWTRRRIVAAASSVAGLDFALARLSHDGGPGDAAASGGMLVMPPLAGPDAAAVLDAWLRSWQPAGPAPLAEATSEAGRWFAGAPVHFGLTSHSAPGAPLPGAPSVMTGLHYVSPFTASCRPATLGVVTAGIASADGSARTSAIALGALDHGEVCSDDCLERLIAWLTRSDLRPDLPGRQFVRVRALAPASASDDFITALRAGETAPVDLADPLVLVMLAAAALGHDAAVATGPRVSAAAIERSGFGVDGPAFFFAVGAPAAKARWTGNVQKFRLDQASLQPADAAPGATGEAFFDPGTGAARAAAESVWPASSGDGEGVSAGGAVQRLPAPDRRRLYSELSGSDLAGPANRIEQGNPRLTRDSLGLHAADRRSVGDLIDWARGRDVFDADHDGDVEEARADLGDPGPAAPPLLRYGDGPDTDATLFVITADGFVHALDAVTGVERWAFVARDLLPRLASLAAAVDTPARQPGPDGALALHVRDTNGDGRILRADGDVAWLYFGLGQASSRFLALDVTEPDHPHILWTLGAAEIPWLASAEAAPVVTRLRIGGPGAPPRHVVILAGGADPAESSGVSAGDGLGAGLVVVDAATGELLLTVTGDVSGNADATLDGAASFAAGPRAVDSDGDGVSDRLYALDVRGGLWRIDMAGSAAPDVRLLGRFGQAENARFHAPVDVVGTTRMGAPAFMLAFGSGWLARPRERTITDSFYAIFDGPTPAAGAIDDVDLVDVTDASSALPLEVSGWKFRLVAHGPGEKVIGASLTVDHRVRFTTYQPLDPTPEEPCGPPQSLSRLYTLDLLTGRPLHFVDDAPQPAEELPLAGLPPALRFALPWRPGDPACGAPCRHRPVGLVGATPVPLDWLNEPLRTSWRELDLAAE